MNPKAALAATAVAGSLALGGALSACDSANPTPGSQTAISAPAHDGSDEDQDNREVILRGAAPDTPSTENGDGPRTGGGNDDQDDREVILRHGAPAGGPSVENGDVGGGSDDDQDDRDVILRHGEGPPSDHPGDTRRVIL